jgi:prepilin-type N-terminal cleavage/methylation domain-containing protein
MHRSSYRNQAFTLLETTVVMAILAILFIITAQTVSKSYKDRYFSKELNSLRTVQMGILAYAEDKRGAGEAPVYPTSLQDLLTEHYVSEKDLDPAITYIRPADSAAADFVILQRQSSQGLLICTIEGPPQKAEKETTPSSSRPTRSTATTIL